MPASSKREARYLLDSSAILAYLLNEPEAARVHTLHQEAALPFIALAELYAAIWLKAGQAKADETIAALRAWQLPWVWAAEQDLLLSGRWRAIYRLGLADSLIAALAALRGLTLVTKDPDFHALKSELKLVFL